MKICTGKQELIDLLADNRLRMKTIGFVPTMGALHAGHLSLVKRSKSENELTVVSIFINPTQFNNASDLKNYPKTIDSDISMLTAAGADYLFEPSVEEMYPDAKGRDFNGSDANAASPKEQFNFGALETVMEGKFRAGHFKGVAQIVKKLFEVVMPHKAYFGEKDFQQLAIIRVLVKEYHLPVEIIPCPTVREPSGLAMSSRNLRLSKEERNEAANISKALFWLRDSGMKYSLAEAKKRALELIDSSGNLKTEYLEIADEKTLTTLEEWNENIPARAFAAVKAGEVRLIDNVALK